MHNAKFSTKCRKCLHWLNRNTCRPKNVNQQTEVLWSPHSTPTPHLLQKLLNGIGTFRQSKERLSLIFKKPPLVAYWQPKSLRDRIVHSRFVSETPQNLIQKGCRACERTKCSWCNKINQTTTFTSPNNKKTSTIFHAVDCHSSWIIYMQTSIHWQKWNSI